MGVDSFKNIINLHIGVIESLLVDIERLEFSVDSSYVSGILKAYC
jgi:hypothetical protein